MERYEAYKDSGIEWIGEIPEGWKLGRTKNCFTHHKEIAGESADNYERLALTMKGVIKRGKDDSDGLQPGSFDGYQILRENELVFKLIDLENVKTSRVGLSPYVGIVSPVYIVLCRNFDNRFAYYWYTNLYNNNVFNFLGGNGVRSALNASDLLNFPYPSISEDAELAIADFLDEKTAEIDGIVSETERSIELLREYRKSVISEAVTKGLDPDAPMKDSGVEWIGEIPEGWEVRRTGSYLRLRDERNGLPLDQVNLISLYTDKGVVQHSDLEKTTGNKAVNADGYKIVHCGDIVVNIILCWMGAIGVSSYEGVTSPAYDVYEVSGSAVPRYLHYLMRTSAFAGECYKYGRGIMAMRWRTYSDQFRMIKTPLPPVQDQVVIADFLDTKTSEIDALIADKEKQVELLKEYRKSLISEAVTGKFKVPGVK